MNTTDQSFTRLVRQTLARAIRARARRALVFAASLVALTLASCAQDSQKQIKQELQTLSSWAATLHLLADSWREGSVPTPYAKKTLENARETLQQESRRVQSASSLATDARMTLVARAQSLDTLAGAIEGALKSEDHAQVAALVEQVSREEQTLADLSQKAGARP